MSRVALVVMPATSTKYPSVQCGLLKAVLEREGVSCDVHYFNLDYAKTVGVDLYESLAHSTLFLSEWPFAKALDGGTAEAAAHVPEAMRLMRARGYSDERYQAMIDAAGPFLDACVDKVDWSRYDVVGFSAVFCTNFACAALAKRIKEKHPGVYIVFGGPNVESVMGRELLKAFPWVDCCVDGEGEKAIVDLARGRRPPSGTLLAGERADLTKLPVPDYDDYFPALARTGLDRVVEPVVWFEGSRGCWWGEKSHCTFCGLNAGIMEYRAKPADQIIAELDYLAKRHKICAFSACDNIIDFKAFDTLLPKLARKIRREKIDFNIFYETKANLTRKQVRQLKAAGVRRIQPGVESFDTQILKEMKKGVTMLQNVALLRACREYDLSATWLLLYGFPKETPEQYRRTLELLPLITHLQPPKQAQLIGLVRYSPYFTGKAQGVKNLGARPEYRYLYGSRCDVDKIAYDFSSGLEDGHPDPEGYAAPLHAFIARWRRDLFARTFLCFERGPGYARVHDYRLRSPEASAPTYRKHLLDGLEAAVFSAAFDARTLGEISKDCGATRQDCETAAAGLMARGLVLREGDKVLTLAVPMPSNALDFLEKAQKLEALESLAPPIDAPTTI